MAPSLLIVDSIQTVSVDEITSAAGSVSQVRECTARLMQWGKSRDVPIFIIGHVTKEGAIAGPRVLEHMVDAVLYLEGERHGHFRVLRAVKNRFGSTDEVGVFEMAESGLREVRNPSEAFLEERNDSATGSSVAVTVEGTRPILVEVQALTTPSAFGLPRRSANGLDTGRLQLLVAVLQKRVGLGLGRPGRLCECRRRHAHRRAGGRSCGRSGHRVELSRSPDRLTVSRDRRDRSFRRASLGWPDRAPTRRGAASRLRQGRYSGIVCEAWNDRCRRTESHSCGHRRGSD